MNTITILTPENIEIKYRLAGVGSRLAAAAIDFLVQALMLAVLFALYLLFLVWLSQSKEAISVAYEDVSVALMFIVSFLIIFGYYIIVELLMNGQTLGKRMLGLRTIRVNGQPIGFVHSLVRTILKIFVDIFGIGVIMMFFNKQYRRIGDYAASTIVVHENARRITAESLNISQQGVVMSASTNFTLTPDETRLLRDYFTHKSEYLDKGKAAFNKIRGYFAARFGVEYSVIAEDMLLEILRMNMR